jgi:hypothetical protein
VTVAAVWHNIDSPLAYALPVFFLFIAIEAAALYPCAAVRSE